jgi:glutamate synthase domain-containing protein 3
MRGGKILIQNNTGYRAGIHMKSYKEKNPVLIVGGVTGSFLGEYQAGGLIVVLGINNPDKKPITGDFCATGMHGGKIFLRTDTLDSDLPEQVIACKATKENLEEIRPHLEEYCAEFGCNVEEILSGTFFVLTPNSKNPYKQLYNYN